MSDKSTIQKIKDFIGFKLPSMEITPEREDEIVEKIVEAVSKQGFELPALIVTAMFYPVSTIFVHTTILPASPIMEFLGLNAYEYAAFLNKKSNIQRIMDRLEETKKEKDAKRTSFWSPGT